MLIPKGGTGPHNILVARELLQGIGIAQHQLDMFRTSLGIFIKVQIIDLERKTFLTNGTMFGKHSGIQVIFADDLDNPIFTNLLLAMQWAKIPGEPLTDDLGESGKRFRVVWQQLRIQNEGNG